MGNISLTVDVGFLAQNLVSLHANRFGWRPSWQNALCWQLGMQTMCGSDPSVKLDKKHLMKDLAAPVGQTKTSFQLKSLKS
jgi:hypothetical protein